MRVLVTGAGGFLGGFMLGALRAAGHVPVRAVRRPAPGSDDVACDFARDTDPVVWGPRLAGIDAVVNVAGILRETRDDTFERVHVAAPAALYRACAAAGVRRVIQISALGAPDDGEFIASKHRGDAVLATLDLDWLVLRPGLVYSAAGAYGGTRLLRALAALPLIPLPQRGQQELQPVAAEDLAQAVVAALARPALARTVVEVVGPEVLTLRAYLAHWHRWFGLPPARWLPTPRIASTATVALGEGWGRGPLCRAIWNLLDRRRVGAADAMPQLQAKLGLAPRTLAQALAERPAHAADLWQARWYLLRPFALATLTALCVVSALAGLHTPAAAAQALLPGWPAALVHALALGGSGADLLFGIWIASGWRLRRALQGLALLVLAYTLGLGVFAPTLWLEPLGGLLKNLPVLVLIGTVLALEPRR